MGDVFISYSRENQPFVERLNSSLEERGRHTWVDWEGIPPTAEWLSEIYGAIDASDAFVFVLSPASVASEVCGKELQHAIDQNKRLIPIVYQEPESWEVPQSLRELNWIFIREDDDFEGAIDTLIEALETDLERVKAHTRLLVRAGEWETHRHHSLLLRSKDLEEAERRFAGGAEIQPTPTPLQLRFITASRRRATRIQRGVLAAVTTGMVIAITLAVVAWVQRQYSQRRETAAVVRNIAPAKPMIALARAVEAMGQWFSDDVHEVRSSLLSAVQTPKEQTIHVRDGSFPVAGVALVQGGAVVAALDPTLAPNDSELSLAVWDAGGRRRNDVAIDAPVVALAGCSVEPVVLVVSLDGSFTIRNLIDGTEQTARVESDASVNSSLESPNRQRPAPSEFETLDAGRVSDSTATEPPRLETDADAVGPPPADLNSYDEGPPQGDLNSYDEGPPSVEPDAAGGEQAPSELDSYDASPTSTDRDSDRAATPTRQDVSRRCSGGAGAVRVAAFSADCRAIVIGRECATEIWSRSPDLRRLRSLPETLTPTAIAIDATGDLIARGYGNGLIRTAVASRQGTDFVDVEYTRHPSGEAVGALAVSPDGAHIASADGSTVRLWRLGEAGLPTQVADGFHGHDDRVTSLAFDPTDGAFLVSGSRDNSIRVWDLAGNAMGLPLRGHDSWIRSVAIAPDGRTIASGSNDGSVRRWEIPRNMTDLPCGDSLGPHRVLAVTDDSQTRLVQAWGSSANRWDLHTLDRECGMDLVAGGPGNQIGTLSRDGRYLAFASEGGQTIVLRDRECDVGDIEIPYPGQDLRALAVCADGTALASGGNDRIIRLWSRADGAWRELPIGHELPIVSLAFGSGSILVASGSEDNAVVVWDVERGEKIAGPLGGHKGWISAVGFNRDGRFIVTGSWDKTVRLWDISGNPMGDPFRGHTDWITHVAFHPDDSTIVSHGNDQRVGVWQGGDSDDWLRASCRQISRHPGLIDADENEIFVSAKAICSRLGFLVQHEEPGDDVDVARASEDDKLGLPVPAADRPFVMPVEGVFSITGRGTVVTGLIEQGVVGVGDEIEIVGMGEPQRKAVIGVEKFGELSDTGQAGDHVGLILKDTGRSDVTPGHVIATPGAFRPGRSFIAEVSLLAREEGSRHAPVTGDYRPQFQFWAREIPGSARLPQGVETAPPGHDVTLSIELAVPVAMARGRAFAIREGGRVVGTGVVTEIID